MNHKYVKCGVVSSVSAALCIAAYFAAPQVDLPDGPGPWYSVIAPLLAVTLAVITGRIMLSLAAAVVAGGLLNSVPGAPLSPRAWVDGLGTASVFVWNSATDPVNLQILAFVVLVLTMISVTITAGGLHGVVQWLCRFAKGPRSAQFVTYLMGLAIFIDDYANTMIVGTSMRAVTDRYRVSREKLTFLVDATSAPVAGLAVISTWVGYEVGLFDGAADSLGIDSNGYGMLFDALPFRFYCVLMLIFVGINIFSRKDFGPMRAAERRSYDTGALSAEDATPMTAVGADDVEPDAGARTNGFTVVIPIAGLFGFLLIGIWLDGVGLLSRWFDDYEGALRLENPWAVWSFTAWREVISGSANNILILAWAAGFALALALVCARILAKSSTYAILPAVFTGARSSLIPITILVLAWSIKAACDSLGTGSFLVAAVGDSVPPTFWPAMTFVIAGLTAFSTGTSFGTMAILIPTMVPIAYALEGDSYGLVTIITLAAILDGSIFGDHCSPISDTTIMSAIACDCDHLHHVRTQLPYSLVVAALALCCGYVPAGFGLPSWLSLGLATFAIVCLFYFLPREAPEPDPPA